MAGQFTKVLNSKATAYGVILGATYGLVMRILFTMSLAPSLFAVMTTAFLVFVPIGIGILTVRESENRSLGFKIFAPWVPTFLTLVATIILGWEGAICVIMAIPIVFPFASVGGIIGGLLAGKPLARSVMLALPFIGSPIETRFGNPERLVETTREIMIAAPPSVVWPLIASVDSIRPDEQRPALFTSMGFPKPISATLSRPGVGGVRTARFERGVVFTETVTEWVPGHKLSFTIDPNTESIPTTTLDPHVTIGGPYFDVLTGTYELIPSADGRRTRLVLHSAHRVSTRFNPYSVWWAERIMGSIQENILEVHKRRAENTRDNARA